LAPENHLSLSDFSVGGYLYSVSRQTDQQLLQDYSERRSEPAFTELVHRYVDLVYSAAVRLARDAHLAEDVTQTVFLALAKSAPRLTEYRVLSGWLHQTTQNLAANVVRSEVRRRIREQEASAMNELLSAHPEATWESVAPHLDAALSELSAADRDAVLLRYFEKKSAAEMADILGVSHEAAQKRVTRAVERLRESFSKRKVTIGAGGLAALISANAVQSAPAALATGIATATLAGTAVATTSITKTIAMTAFQKLLVAAAITAGIVTPILILHSDQAKLAEQDRTIRQRANRLAELEQVNTQLASRVAHAGKSNELTASQQLNLLQLRGQVARLNMDVKQLTRLASATPSANAGSNTLDSLRQIALQRAGQLKQWLEQNPAGKIPELSLVDDETWINAVDGTELNSEDDCRRAMANVRDNAELQALDIMGGALRKYVAAHDGEYPNELSLLSPYFRKPIEDDILARYEIVPSSSLVSQLQSQDGQVITEKAPVDEVWDCRTTMGLTGGGLADCRVTNRWQ
jgi:RNA polymerase sigma factor (sigma-70 family)